MKAHAIRKGLLCLAFAACALQDGNALEVMRSGSSSTFYLSTDMVNLSAPSMRLFFGWQQSVNVLFRLGLDGVSGSFGTDPSAPLLRAGALLLFTAPGLVVDNAFSLTAHDEGHMEAARAIGASYVALVRADSLQEMSIAEFFLEAFNFTSEPGLYLYTKDNLTSKEAAYVAGEGLDVNQLIADAAGREIDQGEGNITDLAPYLLNKVWGINYFLETGPYSDAATYMTRLNEQGYGAVTKTNVIFLTAISCASSGGFLALMRGTYEFIANGSSKVQPLGLKIADVTVFWPEITTWLNADNVSLSTSVDAAYGDFLFLRAGADVPVLGNTSANPELTFGTTLRLTSMSVGLEVTSSFFGWPFLEGGVELPLGNTVSVGIQGFIGNRDTMREQREYPLGPGIFGFVKARI